MKTKRMVHKYAIVRTKSLILEEIVALLQQNHTYVFPIALGLSNVSLKNAYPFNSGDL